MRCKQCEQYIPEGLGMNQCFCGAELPKETSPIEQEKELISNESNTIEEKTQMVTELLTKKQEEQINEGIDRGIIAIFKMGAIWLIAIIVSFIRLAFRHDTTFAVIFFNSTLGILLFIIIGVVLFIYATRNSKFFELKKDLKEKKAIILSAKVSSIEELKGGVKKEYEVFLEKNEANIEKVRFFHDNFSEVKKGNYIKLIVTPNAHFVLSAELDVNSSFKLRRYDRH